MVTTDTVLSSIDCRVGRIVLNRPKALNSLDLGMIRAIYEVLHTWREEPSIHAVLIEGAGGRAFSAGGDIRAVRDAALAGESASIHAFFAEEYALNRLIAGYPKPYIALIDGVCMGGGIGVSVHGAIRVATEAALFAMPETGIGLFPDIGATYILPRLPGRLGLYLGLTGARLEGADAVHAGLATHFVPRANVAALAMAIAQDGPASVAAYAAPLLPFTLAEARPAIDRCFSAPSVDSIMERLEAEGAFGAATLALMRAASPSALDWSFDIITAGADRTLDACLDAELALTAVATRHPDFAEGVRAMVVDKDRKPVWAPRAT